MNKQLSALILSLMILGLMSGCSTTQKDTQSRRTAIEQLLLSEAVVDSFPQRIENPLPIPQDAKIIVDTSGISLDQNIVRHAMSGWLGKNGYLVQEDKESATHRVSVNVQALGTEYADTFVGMPPIQGGLIPISVPELTIYKAQYQTGYVKFYFDIFELPSGRFVQSMPPFLAEKYYNAYTLLFLLSFNKTDLIAPPQFGVIGRKANRLQVND